MSIFFKPARVSDKRKKSDFIKPLEGMAQGVKEQRAVLEMAHYYQHVQSHLQQLIQAPMNAHCYVTSYQEGQLHLAVPSAAFAAKLRQMAPSLAQAMSNCGYPISTLKIKVIAGLSRSSAPEARQATRTNSPAAAHAALQKLYHELAPGPLSEAIQSILVKRGLEKN